MTQNDSDWKRELEESAQGIDLFEAPGADIHNQDARDSAVDWESGSSEDPQRPSHVERARSRRHSLRAAMAGLEATVAAASGADGWFEAVSAAVDELRLALRDHVEVTEGPDGLLNQILNEEPRFATEIALIAQEHEGLDESLEKLDLTVKAGLEMEDPEPDSVRRRAMTLLGRLSLHRQRGSDLVYDAYNVDIATGD